MTKDEASLQAASISQTFESQVAPEPAADFMEQERKTSVFADLFVRRIVLFLLLAWLICGAAFVAWGRYTGDEGMYSLIGREAWKGRLMYRDLRCSQMPLMPYLYGAVMQFLPARIESGRVISLIFTFAGLVCAWLLVSKRYGARAGLFGFLVLILNRQLLFDGTQVKTQALAFFLATACLLCLSSFDLQLRAQSGEKQKADASARLLRAWALRAGLLVSAAVCARLSVLPIALALPFAVAWVARRYHFSNWRSLFVVAAVSSWAPLAIVVGFFAIAAGDRFFFNVYGYHRLLGHLVSDPQLELFLGFLSVSFQATSIWCIAIIFFALVWGRDLWRAKGATGRAPHRGLADSGFARADYAFELFVLMLWIATTLLHGMQKMSAATHQIPLGWAACILGAALAARFSRLLFISRSRFFGAATGLVIICALVWSGQEAPLFYKPQDRLRTPAGIYDLAAPLRAAPGSRLAIFEAGLVFCAPQSVPLPGYELMEFSLVPRIGAERQEFFRGISGRRLESDLLHHADFYVARRQDFGYLTTGDPTYDLNRLNIVLPLYQLVYQMPAYGQLNQSITLWKRKPMR